jgi:hypothetical protein
MIETMTSGFLIVHSCIWPHNEAVAMYVGHQAIHDASIILCVPAAPVPPGVYSKHGGATWQRPDRLTRKNIRYELPLPGTGPAHLYVCSKLQ